MSLPSHSNTFKLLGIVFIVLGYVSFCGESGLLAPVSDVHVKTVGTSTDNALLSIRFWFAIGAT